MPKPFSNLRSAAIDGRLHNPRYAKSQLKKLHDVLRDNVSEIQAVIARDTGHRAAEIKVECWLAMRCLTDAHGAIDTEKALRDEYAVARGDDAPDARQPVGVVVIETAAHTFFYSVISALVPAIAAGNCVVVQVDQSMLETPPLVLRLISEALDKDVFHFTAEKVTEADLSHPHIRVLQSGAPSPPSHHLPSHPDALVAAVVERDADVPAAARALVLARFGLRGASPYAPDIVLVNEWVKKEFLMAVTQSCVSLAEAGGVGSAKRGVGQGLLDEVVKEGSASVVSAGKDGVVLDVENRASVLLGRKLRGCCLAVHAVTSMDDAIDTMNSLGRLSAAYVFTTPPMAKYICQFIDTDASFVNHVPPTLLFGPVAPRDKPFNPAQGRYSPTHFTVPKPQYVTQPTGSSRISNILSASSPQQLQALDAEASVPLSEMKRPEKPSGIGFFNQGIVTGGILFLATVVSCTGGVAYFAARSWPLLWPRLSS